MWWNERRRETWEEARERMVAETSVYITDALQHPEISVRIPVVVAGEAEFPPSLSRAFWDAVLVE